MKVVSIGTDRKIFEEGAAARQRMVEYGKIFDELHIVVFTTRKHQIPNIKYKISENVFAYPTDSKSRLSYVFDAIRLSRKIIKERNLSPKDIVVSCQDPFETGLAGVWLKLCCGLPLQLQLHTDFANRYFAQHSLLNFIRFIMGHITLPYADQVRCVSGKAAQAIQSVNKSVSVLPINIDKSRYENEAPESRSGSLNVFTACRLEKEKDVGTAIKAFKIFSDRFPEARFYIAGEGSQRKKLESLAERLGLSDKVRFLGWQEDLKEMFRRSDIYISASLYEGYGMAAVEAAFYSLPLVLSATGVANGMFRDGESALVCRQRDHKGFALALIKLGEDKDLREGLGRAAREEASKSALSDAEYLERYQEAMESAQNKYSQRGFMVRLAELLNRILEGNRILRFLIAGSFAALSQILLLYILTDKAHIWYLTSSMISFAYGVTVSFFLQKFWAFRDGDTGRVRSQFMQFIGVALLGIAVNTPLMYLWVDLLGIWYVLAQVITGLIIMVANFLIYKYIIFKR